MLNNVPIHALINAIVPISRFNKGEANKIFDEVKMSGYKIVMKNNTPACVLLTPERYEEMTEQLEDYALLMEAQKRMESPESADTLSEKMVLQHLGISEEELQSCEVELD